jgi:UDP-N-acetylmuramoyl-tripeptide--D-alanyl-D-alanine ligase
MLKSVLKQIVLILLNWETRLILRKYKPRLFGVTGNVGKTSTKEAIAAVLSSKYRVRKSEKSYNSELGVPLTVIGCHTAWLSLTGWLKILYEGLTLILTPNDYPEWLVLEIGADRPGDIKNLVRRIRFDAAAVSRLPDVPVHIEFFKNKEEVVAEKMSLPLSISPNGFVILNADDQNIMSYRDRIKANVITFGFASPAAVKAANDEIVYTDNKPMGVSFQAEIGGESLPVTIAGALGTHLIYPALAGLAAGQAFGVGFSEALKSLAAYVPPPGRLHLVAGQSNSTILDDTYNSSPIALEAALKTLGQIETAGRKIAVIGNMMELGKHTAESHKEMGELAARVANMIITVGVRARFAYEAAQAAGFDSVNLKHFDDSSAAGEYLKNEIKTGDIILVKGSQSARMEKVVEKIMAEPEKKKELLVRQEPEWENR